MVVAVVGLIVLLSAPTVWWCVINTCYPKHWREVSNWISRTEVHAKCGAPAIDGKGVETDVWFRNGPYGYWRLVVTYDPKLQLVLKHSVEFLVGRGKAPDKIIILNPSQYTGANGWLVRPPVAQFRSLNC